MLITSRSSPLPIFIFLQYQLKRKKKIFESFQKERERSDDLCVKETNICTVLSVGHHRQGN